MPGASIDWIVLIPDHENALEKRMKARPSHLEGLQPRIKCGAWVMGGATVSSPPIEGEPKQFNGSCLVARAQSKEEVMEELRKDVYAKEGVWNLDKAQVLPLMTAFPNVVFEDFQCKSFDGGRIPVRLYRQKQPKGSKQLPVYVWYHGGGFLFGSISGEDGHCFKIVNAFPLIVVNVCYGHTPEFRWPTHAEDAAAALNWVLIAGRSAGGLLAAGVVIRDREIHGRNRFPRDLIAPGKTSYDENQRAPILPRTRMDLFEHLVGEDAISDRLFNILCMKDEDLAGSPPTHFHIAGRDILRDHAFLLKSKLERVGTKTSFNVYPGMPHGFRRYGELEASMRWDRDHFRAIEDLLEIQITQAWDLRQVIEGTLLILCLLEAFPKIKNEDTGHAPLQST
ncbi:uncharacterized protein Z518_07366 [Rhinocladiella mackenziei CBS 650.93]|uniref:Alpha/beta hydrolase fold-3 domain-containing protein n=1 Tax=Rhinocladiella mackenziei CBS 650.93 TaxID=1442369 RepID=A0A0D2H046_9EURO|nr:uncharacterized protein Z518_07366 [Rhinocladiella mackenziei CBS 650.93]KIX03813.1 hypothetical protein Z518_07366 [Rhinocladiella mackenziei CBS 650.93]